MRALIFLALIFASKQSFGNCEPATDISRVVAAGGSLTEIIYFLEADENLVARDLTSNYPPEALALPSIGYLRNLSTEGLLSLMPTLILGESDAGPVNVLDQLRDISVDFRTVSATYDMVGIISKIVCVATILGVEDEFLNFKLRELQSDNEKLEKKTNFDKKKILLVLMMRGTSPIIAGSDTAGDGFIKMTGNLNAFNDVKGWKPVGAENILSIDPDVIIVTERGFSGFETANDFLAQSGLHHTKAGRNGALIVADTMEMLGFGPRTLGIASEISLQIQSQ